jgi:glycerophosphoryl diester phosphodiesterase
LDELSKYKGLSDQMIPTLEQVIDLVNRRCVINVELKGPGTAKPVSELIEAYVKHKGFSYDDFFVSSFNHHELLRFHKLLPSIKTGAIMEAIPVTYAAFVDDAEADYAVLCKDAIHQELIDDAHRRNKKVFVYTVNSQADIQAMKNLKVDGIISNFPDRVRL